MQPLLARPLSPSFCTELKLETLNARLARLKQSLSQLETILFRVIKPTNFCQNALRNSENFEILELGKNSTVGHLFTNMYWKIIHDIRRKKSQRTILKKLQYRELIEEL